MVYNGIILEKILGVQFIDGIAKRQKLGYKHSRFVHEAVLGTASSTPENNNLI